MIRRTFLRRTSTAAALGLVARWPVRELWEGTPAELAPEVDEAFLRTLALTAIDVARGAGAAFADVRMSAARTLGFRCDFDVKGRGKPVTSIPPWLLLRMSYGVRALVGGVWGFGSGTDMTPDGVAQAARSAVAAAKAGRSRQQGVLDLAPVAPVSNGTWETPIQKDPFSVSIQEQLELSLAVIGSITAVPEAIAANAVLEWRRPVSIFASSEGSVIVQRYTYGGGGFGVRVAVGPSPLDEGADGPKMRAGPVGYEMLDGKDWAAELRDTARKTVERTRETRLAKPVEVGRYDIVFGAGTLAGLLTSTICEALDAKRALGYHANSAGTSFAAPPLDMLGQYQIASPLLTVTADRSRRGGAATVGWDEEGVKPIDYVIVREGIIVDYHNDRETAPQLGDWYRAQDRPVLAQGNARRIGSKRPAIVAPNLTVEPGPGSTTQEDLVRSVKRGFFVDVAIGGADQQVTNAQYAVPPVAARRIVNGRLGGYVRDFAFQFLTPSFWKSLDALAGRAAVESVTIPTDGISINDRMQPLPLSTIDVVPGRVRQVNVLNTGRTA